jgi:hypothetical protein
MAVDQKIATQAQRVLTEILFSDEDTNPLQETIDRYLTADYEQESDGKIYDRERFAEHVREDFREPTERATVTVDEIIRQDNRVAQRHHFDITKRDGSTIRMDVHLFAEYAGDGRLRRMRELTHTTAADKA